MEWRNLHSRELGLLTKCRGGDLPEFLARKLETSTVLNGHTGCVNRLAWNQDGSLLASASDDCQVLLWHYPDTSRVPIALETEHRANLFGVAILPFSNNCKIVSGAMDYTVQLHELGEGAFNITPKYRSSLNSTRGSSGNGAPPPMRRHPPSPQVHVVKPRTTIFHCHKSRVKEVEVCLAEPSLFWSAGEDGVVRQYDARTPDQKAYGSANVLVNLMTAGPSGGLVECKGLSVNQQNPNLMGVACGDPYVRLFDRRKLSTCRPGGGPTSALLQLTAPHLPLELAAGMIRRCHATHCSFSHKGDRLVASFHGDHAYIFYVTGAAGQHTQQLSPQQQQRQQQRVRRRLQQEHDFADLSPSASPKQQKQQQLPTQQQQQQQQQQHQGQPVSQAGNGSSMPEAADAARVSGNNALFEQSYTAAIGHFTAAIAAAPQAAGLYTQRALALLKRGWEGDASFALRDCETAVQLVLQQQQQQQQGDGSSSLSGHRESSGGGSSSNGGSNGSSSVEQQARLRLVHALKQLGQVKCALAALDSYKELYPAAASSSDVATLEKFLQEHLQRRLAYKRKVATSTARLRRTRQETAAAAGTGFAARRQQQQAQEQRQQQQQVVGASIPPAPPAPPAQQQQGSDAQQQQQQEQEQQQPSAAAMSRSVSSGGSSSGGSSRSASPLGGRPPDPPGRGIRVDTDVDSEDLERDTEMQTTSAAAAAAAAAAGASEVMSAAAAAAAAAESAEGYLHSFIGPVLPEGFSTAAAAAVATQPPPPPPPRPAAAAAAAPEGMVVESWSGSAGDESSPGSDPMSEGDDDSQAAGLRSSLQPLLVDPELPAEPITEDELLEDELLAPWYGPAVFCRPGPHARPGASVRTGKEAHMQQQQQQQPLSGGGSGGSSSSSGSRRRRPRSNSGDDIDAADSDDEDAMLTPARRQAGDGSRWRSGQQQQQQQQWWDVFCGGQGRLLQRCIGQCNVQTDIKEAVFLGQDDALVACGSDDGYVFIYNSHTGNPVKVLAADEDVANCVQPHPHLPVLATSGIDTVVRLWAPTGVADMGSCERYVTENQARMRDGARPLRAGMVPPHILQAALGDNPQLLQMLLQQLYRPTTPAAGGAAAAAGGGAAAGARGGPASEGTPEAGRQGLGPVPGIEIVGLGAEEDDEDESDDESGEEGFGVNDEDEDEGLEGHGEEGGVGRARRRRPPRRQVQEVTCRMS